MSVAIYALAAIGLTTAGYAYLTIHDPKRRRAFRLGEGSPPQRKGLAWAALYLPGLALLIVDQWAAFLMWLGGAPIVGWAIAVIPPTAYARLRDKSMALIKSMRKIELRFTPSLKLKRTVKSTATIAEQRTIADLEARIVALEKQLAARAQHAPKTTNHPVAPAMSETDADVARITGGIV